MRRVAHPYTVWEGWQAGMYGLSDQPEQDTAAAAKILGDPRALGDAMRKALALWPLETEHWLSRPGATSRSWLGGAGCMAAVGAPILCTRAAWWKLTAVQQAEANAVADAVRELWITDREAS